MVHARYEPDPAARGQCRQFSRKTSTNIRQKSETNDVACLTNDERVLMFRSSFFDGQILGYSPMCVEKLCRLLMNDERVFMFRSSSFDGQILGKSLAIVREQKSSMFVENLKQF